MVQCSHNLVALALGAGPQSQGCTASHLQVTALPCHRGVGPTRVSKQVYLQCERGLHVGHVYTMFVAT